VRSRVLRVQVDIAVFFDRPMEVVPPFKMSEIDEAIQDAIRRTMPGAGSTGKAKIEIKVDGRFDVRKMDKLLVVKS